MSATETASDLVRIYMADIGRRPLLSAEDERRLAIAIEEGRDAAKALDEPGLTPAQRRRLRRAVVLGQDARREFVEANLRLVVAIAGRYRRREVDRLDLIQEGNVGLVHAVDRFDWRRGNRFSTYATLWIRQSITRALDTSARSIRLPVHREAENRALARTRQGLEAVFHRPPTVDELAEATGLTAERVLEDLQLPQASVSLSTPIDDDGRALVEALPDPSAESPEDQTTERARRAELTRLVATLPPRWQTIVELRFGLLDGMPRTREQVAKRLGVTPERIRQLEVRALARMRQSAPAGLFDQLLAA